MNISTFQALSLKSVRKEKTVLKISQSIADSGSLPTAVASLPVQSHHQAVQTAVPLSYSRMQIGEYILSK